MAADLPFGTIELNSVRLGDNELKAVYKATTRLWRPGFEFRTSATANAASITVPSTAVAGDIAVIIDFAKNAATASPTVNVPSGWFQMGGAMNLNNNPNFCRTQVYRKELVSGDIGASATGMSGTSFAYKIIMIFRRNSILNFTTGPSSVGEANTGDPALQTLVNTSFDAPCIVIGYAACPDVLPSFTTANPAFDAQITNTRLRVGYKIYRPGDATTTDHTLDMGDNGAVNMIGLGAMIPV